MLTIKEEIYLYERGFIVCNKEIFNNILSFVFKTSNKYIAVAIIKNGIYIGKVVKTLKEALSICKEFYDKDNGYTLSIGDYRPYKPVTIWETKSILHKLKYISNKEYNEYIKI